MNQGSVRQHTRVHGTRRRATSDMDQGSVRQHTRVHGMGRRTNYAVIHETRAIIENSALNHPVTLEGNMIRTHAMINLINSTSESRSEPIMINQSGLPPMYHELERRKSLNAPQSPTPPSYEEFMAMPDKYSNCP